MRGANINEIKKTVDNFISQSCFFVKKINKVDTSLQITIKKKKTISEIE